MIYKDFSGEKIPALGLGCMRFPLASEDYADIDIEKTAEIVDYAIKSGVNYFDTAWAYHSGQSETVMGKILSKYPRESYFLASKFPGYDRSLLSRTSEIFEKQLEKCRVDYFDFYLFHNVSNGNVDGYLDEKLGVFDYLYEQKRNGRIKHLGFSCHGNLEVLQKFLEKYGKYMEFCQLQINWMDYHFQNAKEKIELLDKYNIPVWVMEPLRGGRLVNLDSEYDEMLKEADSSRSNVEWAFRFIQSFPQLILTLSGMSSLEQLKENIRIFSTGEPLNKNEIELLFNISAKITSKGTLPCTSCRYCTEKCPKKLDIPTILDIYNTHCLSGGNSDAKEKILAMSLESRPSACIGCGGCEKVCPQEIKISKAMSDFRDKFNIT